MAQQPHDRTGLECSVCGVPFTKTSYVGTITRKLDGYFTPRLLCRKCHNDHYSKGE